MRLPLYPDQSRQLTICSFCAILLLQLISPCRGRALPWPSGHRPKPVIGFPNRRASHPDRHVQPSADQAMTSNQDSSPFDENLQREVHSLEGQVVGAMDEMEALRQEVARLGEQVGSLQSQVELVNHYRRTAPKMTCRANYTRWIDAIGKTLEYLHGFNVHCGHGEFLRTWEMSWGEMGIKKRIRFVCCRFQHH